MSASHGLKMVMSGSREPATHSSKRQEADPREASIDWLALVDRVRTGDETGMEELYKRLNQRIRYYLCRQLGPQELGDKVHDTFLIVVRAIQREGLREPERLMGFVRTIAQRQIASYIDEVVKKRSKEVDLGPGSAVADRREGPEYLVLAREKAEFMKSVLATMSQREREILERFYLKEQTEQQIRAEMSLTATQFRLLKSRAKARFGEFGKKRLEKKPLSSVKPQLLKQWATG